MLFQQHLSWAFFEVLSCRVILLRSNVSLDNILFGDAHFYDENEEPCKVRH
jgi:hypothetical protein